MTPCLVLMPSCERHGDAHEGLGDPPPTSLALHFPTIPCSKGGEILLRKQPRWCRKRLKGKKKGWHSSRKEPECHVEGKPSPSTHLALLNPGSLSGLGAAGHPGREGQYRKKGKMAAAEGARVSPRKWTPKYPGSLPSPQHLPDRNGTTPVATLP